MVVVLRHEERQREIRYQKKLNDPISKADKGNGKDISNPQSSSHRGNWTKPCDKGSKMIRFFDTSKSNESYELKRMHQKMDETLKGILASL
jgi:hypothetical protein